MKDVVFSVVAVTPAILFALGLDASADENLKNLIFVMLTLIFAIQWAGFIIASYFKTEKFFDITGSLTYLAAVWWGFYSSGARDGVALLLALLVSIWAVRLGSYLFIRILKDGEDKRFREIKHNPPRFFLTWTLQGLWVFLTLLSVEACFLSPKPSESYNHYVALGCAVWLLGFTIEVIADKQKKTFRADSKNKGDFITSGLWSYSRHPNYAGEITLWLGISLIALPSFSGLLNLGLISPLFVYWLLSRVSGVPMLEESALKRWGEDPRFQEYLNKTPVLFPWSHTGRDSK